MRHIKFPLGYSLAFVLAREVNVSSFLGVGGGRSAGQPTMASFQDAVDSHKETTVCAEKSSTIFAKLDSLFPNIAADISVRRPAGVLLLLGITGESDTFHSFIHLTGARTFRGR